MEQKSPFTHLLVATDGSECAQRAVAHAVALAGALKARITFLAATEPWPVLRMAQQAVERKMHPIEDYERHAAEWAQGVLDKAGEAARGQGVACDSVHAADQHASDAILQTVQARGCDGIVMGSHGRRGVARLAMGSAASDVLAGAKTPVIVVR